MNKLSLHLSFVALSLSIVYFFYAYFVLFSPTLGAQIDQAFAEFFRQPHIIALALGILINAIGLMFHYRFFILVAAFLYSLSILLNLPLFYYVIIQAGLLFYSYFFGAPDRDGLI